MTVDVMYPEVRKSNLVKIAIGLVVLIMYDCDQVQNLDDRKIIISIRSVLQDSGLLLHAVKNVLPNPTLQGVHNWLPKRRDVAVNDLEEIVS